MSERHGGASLLERIRAGLFDEPAASAPAPDLPGPAAPEDRASLVADISHDIHTPLNGVIGMLELLLDSGLTPQQREFAQMAQDSAEELLLCVNDLLEYAGARQDSLGLESAAFDLRREIEAAALPYHAAAQAKGLTLQCRYPETALPQVLGNPLRLRQAVASLLGNAIRFTSAGRVALDVAAEVQGQFCRLDLAVTDSQSGAVRASGHDPVAQMRAAAMPELGLAACKHLVEMMGGQMSAKNEAGSSRTFRIALQLPLAPAAREPQADARAAPANAEFAGYRVLVADDVEVNRQVAVHLLQKLGCTVDIAADGLQATALHVAHPFDLILMDCQMPELDGYAAAERIRAAESGQRTPIVALTACIMQGERERCRAAGMDDFLAKPVRMRTLRAALQRWLAPRAATVDDSDAGDELEMMQEMFGDDFPALATLYLSDSRKRLDTLREAVHAVDAVRCASVVHSFGGSCSSIGAPRLAAMCKEFELRCKAGELEGGVDRLDAIVTEYHRVENKLNRMMQGGT